MFSALQKNSCPLQEDVISKLKTLNFCIPLMRDICIHHPFHRSVFLTVHCYSLLDAFQSTPCWLWRTVSFLSWAIPMIWGSWKCVFAIWHLLLWWHGLFGFPGLKLVTNHSGTETSWGISFWGVERFHSPKATVSSPQLPTYHKSDNSKTMPRSTHPPAPSRHQNFLFHQQQ